MKNIKRSRGKSDGRSTPASVIKKRAEKKNGRGKLGKPWYIEARQANTDEPIYNAPKSQLLDAFLPKRQSIYLPKDVCYEKDGTVILNNFSFLENPVGTMDMLSEIIEVNSRTENNHIHFVDPICRDMAPYMVLNLIENDLESDRIKGGTISSFARKVLEETNFVEHFNMEIDGDLDQSLKIWPIKIDFCRQSTAESYKDNLPPHAELSDRFTKQIENWLLETGFSLSEEGVSLLMRMIGEVLNNAILHSRLDIGGEAWISGFMLQVENPQGETEYVCHISILNLGQTIYESMQSCDDKIRQEIESLVRQHRTKFRVRKYWTKEALWMLYALQDGVTSMGSPDDPRGGKGLMDMIAFFSEIGTSDYSKLGIISGNVAINISDPKPSEDARGMRRLALNEENDLSQAPKKEYIKILRKPFPGTILTWRFFLNPKHLEKLVNN